MITPTITVINVIAFWSVLPGEKRCWVSYRQPSLQRSAIALWRSH
ncbi:hypothetical protein [Leptothermofonsia sichuanensis]|nr:hypothetical protein [Leptothermofonsia sichuanensis]